MCRGSVYVLKELRPKGVSEIQAGPRAHPIHTVWSMIVEAGRHQADGFSTIPIALARFIDQTANEVNGYGGAVVSTAPNVSHCF